ncbi:acid protease [Serendipita vermifera]|nr:acid protease [Serendipita vermifera]
MGGTPSFRLDLNSVPSTLVCLLLVTLNANAAVVNHPRATSELDLDGKGPSRADAGVLHLPLTRRYGRPVDQQDNGQWARNQREYLRMKYSDPSTINRNGASLHSRANGTAHLVNHNTDSAFYTGIAIGTPPVIYNVILDTGSADLWVAGETCQVGCQDVPKFTPSSSIVLASWVCYVANPDFLKFNVRYGSATASGSLGRDVVQMSGYQVQDQVIGVADAVSLRLLDEPVSGLMGLAFRGIAASGGTPFWLRLAAAEVFDQPLMSFCLTRFLGVDNATDSEPGGVFTLGGVNSSLYEGEIDYVSLPIAAGTYWSLPLKSLTIQGTAIPLQEGSSSYAAIDTGTTLIGGPAEYIDQIAALIPGSTPGTEDYEDYFLYPCETNVTVTLSFGSRTWSIEPRDFRLMDNGDGRCVSAFFKLSMGVSAPKWIIGDTFLKNVYSVFRYEPPSVGFADLSQAALAMNDVSGHLPTPSLGASVIVTGQALRNRDLSWTFSFFLALWLSLIYLYL